MERQNVIMLSATAAGLFVLPGCATALIPNVDADRTGWTRNPEQLPPAQATKAYSDCQMWPEPTYLEDTYKLFQYCVLETDRSLVPVDKLTQISQSDKMHPSINPVIAETLKTAKEALGKEKVNFLEWRFPGTHEQTITGCTSKYPFYAFLILANGDKYGNRPDQIIADAFHGLFHLADSYKRYKNGESCPWIGTIEEKEREETEASYYGKYMGYLARVEGYKSDSRSRLLKDFGYDPFATVGDVLVPMNLGPDSRIYKVMVNDLFPLWLMRNRSPEYLTEDDKKEIVRINELWRNFLKTATQQELQAIQMIVEKKHANIQFFQEYIIPKTSSSRPKKPEIVLSPSLTSDLIMQNGLKQASRYNAMIAEARFNNDKFLNREGLIEQAKEGRFPQRPTRGVVFPRNPKPVPMSHAYA